VEYLIGFIIAVFIALTGVGAGTITTPLLILALGVPAGIAVSVGLMFSAAVKLVLLPGAKKADGEKKVRAPKSGSAQAKAMEHPIVQRAQTLFNAEIRNVIDLRDND